MTRQIASRRERTASASGAAEEEQCLRVRSVLAAEVSISGQAKILTELSASGAKIRQDSSARLAPLSRGRATRRARTKFAGEYYGCTEPSDAVAGRFAAIAIRLDVSD